MRKRLTCLMLAMLLCGCSTGIQLKKQTFTIELGKDIYANPSLYVKDTIDVSSLKVVSNSIGIENKDNRFVTSGMDYLVVGEYDFSIVDGKTEYPFVIKVKDTVAPVCSSNVSQITVAQYSNIDWNSYFNASDLSGVTFETNVDTSQVGTQDVTVKISDRFGNSVTKNVSVVIE